MLWNYDFSLMRQVDSRKIFNRRDGRVVFGNALASVGRLDLLPCGMRCCSRDSDPSLAESVVGRLSAAAEMVSGCNYRTARSLIGERSMTTVSRFHLTPPENALIARPEKGSLCITSVCLSPQCPTWPIWPGKMHLLSVHPQPRPKRRRKPSDVSGLRSLPGKVGDTETERLPHVSPHPVVERKKESRKHGFQDCSCRRHR